MKITSSIALGASSFDFLPGAWDVAMRQRTVDGELRVLDDWVSFEASASFEKVLNGQAIFGQYMMRKIDGVHRALDMRFYNPDEQSWTIYWANEKDRGWQKRPMKGGATIGDAMEFVMEDRIEEHAVLTRYTWKVPSPNQASWRQSFSNDRGTTWISNWTMDFARAGS